MTDEEQRKFIKCLDKLGVRCQPCFRGSIEVYGSLNLGTYDAAYNFTRGIIYAFQYLVKPNMTEKQIKEKANQGLE